ncbi:MAG: DUF2939 domain-containing protein [Caulobacteraceae bacterium]
MGPVFRGRIAIVTALFLAGCASVGRLSAAGDVHALLIAIRDDDRATFDAHVDKPALEARLQSELVYRARSANLADPLTAASVLFSGPLSRAAGAVLIQPRVFRAVADYYGYRPETPIPGTVALATVLTTLPGDRVCATRKKGGACLLTFARRGGTWRLVDVDPAMLQLKAPGR